VRFEANATTAGPSTVGEYALAQRFSPSNHHEKKSLAPGARLVHRCSQFRTPASNKSANLLISGQKIQATFMQWQPISSLTPNRLVFLLIEHMQNSRWVGYVDGNGICAWPEKIQGLRPAAWQEVLADLTRLQVISE
jgi:hypothetical protein